MQRLPERFWRRALILTLALGSTVAISWLIFGGTIAFRGPMRVLADRWLLIYASQALLAGLVGFALANRAPRTSMDGMGLVVAVAWIGEGLGLALELTDCQMPITVGLGRRGHHRRQDEAPVHARIWLDPAPVRPLGLP